MSEIPEDVMEAALGVVSAQWDLGYSRTQQTLTDLIARAILAERERCAQEADSWKESARKLASEEKDPDRRLYHSLAGDMARDIAAAIRGNP